VLSSRNVARVNVNSVNFRINTGVVVPRTVTFVSVAAFPVLIDYFPAYRDYSFFVVEDEIVFVDRRRTIVDVVPVGPRARFAGGGRVRGGSVAVLDLSPEEIRIVQRVLIERGLLIGEADGVLGVRTRQALNVFQRRQGFQATGTIDTRTVAALGVSNKISASQGQSTTVGQGQGGQQPAAQQNRQAPAGQAGRQQPSAETTGQAGRQQPSSETKAGKQEPSGQTTGQAPAKGNKQPSARQPSGQTYAPSKGGQSDQGGSGRKY
jgi:peptidoglycan hydrolase-like protein with peptidoglycan-binding domain